MNQTAIDIETAKQIRKAHKKFCYDAGKAVEGALFIGELLVNQKKKTKHGEWQRWLLDADLGFGIRQAQNYITIAQNKLYIIANANLLHSFTTIRGVLECIKNPSEIEAEKVKERFDGFPVEIEGRNGSVEVVGNRDFLISDKAAEVLAEVNGEANQADIVAVSMNYAPGGKKGKIIEVRPSDIKKAIEHQKATGQMAYDKPGPTVPGPTAPEPEVDWSVILRGQEKNLIAVIRRLDEYSESFDDTCAASAVRSIKNACASIRKSSNY